MAPSLPVTKQPRNRNTWPTVRVRCKTGSCREMFDAPSAAAKYCPKCRVDPAVVRAREEQRRQDAVAIKLGKLTGVAPFEIVCRDCQEPTPAWSRGRIWCDRCRGLDLARRRRDARAAKRIGPLKKRPGWTPREQTCIDCGTTYTANASAAKRCKACAKSAKAAAEKRRKAEAVARARIQRAAIREERRALVAAQARLEAETARALKAAQKLARKAATAPQSAAPRKPPIESAPRPPRTGMCPVCYDMAHVRDPAGCPGCGEARVEREAVRASSGYGCGLASVVRAY